MTSATEPEPQRRFDQVRARRATRPQSHVIGEDFFKSIVRREFRRTERSNLSAAIVLVSLGEGAIAPAKAWRPVVAALNAAKRETDIIGWFRQGVVLGVIFPDLRSSDSAALRNLEIRIKRELVKHVDATTCKHLTIDVQLNPSLRTADQPGVEPSLRELCSRRPLASSYAAVKRGIDIVASGLLLLVLLPLLSVVALIVRLTSKGPILFKQVRIGEGGRPFTMLKFRTMQVNADASVHKDFITTLINSSETLAQSGTAAPFKLSHDPRVTRIGRVLRKSSIDELPQLWNVFRGDMSLVGPRPPIAYEVAQYKHWHKRRLFEAKPGITGLWQVAGRSRTTFDEMVRLDLRYAKSCSLMTDAKILLMTPAAVITGKGAS